MQDVSTTILDELDYLPKIPGRKDYRIGIIGAGRIAQRRQIPAYRYAGLTVSAVADVKQEALDRARRDYGIERGYLDYRQLLEQADIDIVDVCTNTFPRKQITLDALAAGKHVLSEKPFARSYADALQIVNAAEQAGVHLAIHQPTRWYYPCAVTRELIIKGFLGDVFYIELRLHGNQDTVYYEDPVTRWHADLTDHIFVEWGAHYFDLVRWFAGGETPSSVFAWGTRKGNEHFKSKMSVAAAARFESGTCASLSLNQAGRFTNVPLGAMAGDILVGIGFASRVRGGVEGKFDWTQRLPKEEDPTNYLWFDSIRSGHLWPMAELINSINEDREALCSGRENLDTVATYLAAMKSDEENRPVSPKEMKG